MTYTEPVLVPPMPTFTARYVCGDCDYDRTAPWPKHEFHHQAHDGWVPFGLHAADNGWVLEFKGDDGTGLPVWERRIRD